MPATLANDIQLSKYNPLPRILSFDDFDEGAHGWCELVGNHNGDLNELQPVFSDMRPPQLSTCTFFDLGTHGSMNGTYSLKLATRPRQFHQAVGIKRLTSPTNGRVQVETWFTYKAEQTFGPNASEIRAWDGNYHPSEAQFGSFTIWNDICEGTDPGQRYMCALRYENTNEAGEFTQRWMYKTALHPTTRMLQGGTPSAQNDVHVARPDQWAPVPGGNQQLCFNEVPTKVNWHYLRWQFDLASRQNIELQVNDLTMDLTSVPVPKYEDQGYWGINRLLNFCFDVRTTSNVRNFLCLDAVLISVDW